MEKHVYPIAAAERIIWTPGAAYYKQIVIDHYVTFILGKIPPSSLNAVRILGVEGKECADVFEVNAEDLNRYVTVELLKRCNLHLQHIVTYFDHLRARYLALVETTVPPYLFGKCLDADIFPNIRNFDTNVKDPVINNEFCYWSYFSNGFVRVIRESDMRKKKTDKLYHKMIDRFDYVYNHMYQNAMYNAFLHEIKRITGPE